MHCTVHRTSTRWISASTLNQVNTLCRRECSHSLFTLVTVESHLGVIVVQVICGKQCEHNVLGRLHFRVSGQMRRRTLRRRRPVHLLQKDKSRLMRLASGISSQPAPLSEWVVKLRPGPHMGRNGSLQGRPISAEKCSSVIVHQQ